ncbi:MAG: hypothetical protein AABY53_01150 [Bdellovibrionota bacterium]
MIIKKRHPSKFKKIGDEIVEIHMIDSEVFLKHKDRSNYRKFYNETLEAIDQLEGFEKLTPQKNYKIVENQIKKELIEFKKNTPANYSKILNATMLWSQEVIQKSERIAIYPDLQKRIGTFKKTIFYIKDDLKKLISVSKSEETMAHEILGFLEECQNYYSKQMESENENNRAKSQKGLASLAMAIVLATDSKKLTAAPVMNAIAEILNAVYPEAEKQTEAKLRTTVHKFKDSLTKQEKKKLGILA